MMKNMMKMLLICSLFMAATVLAWWYSSSPSTPIGSDYRVIVNESGDYEVDGTITEEDCRKLEKRIEDRHNDEDHNWSNAEIKKDYIDQSISLTYCP